MSSVSQKAECNKHQWMSFAIDGSCIKCVSCGEIRMIDCNNSTNIITLNKKN
jgi:hypothetical protein